MHRLTEKEREVLREAVQSLNLREDLMGALISRTSAYQKLGDEGVVRLAKKLEAPEQQHNEVEDAKLITLKCGCMFVAHGEWVALVGPGMYCSHQPCSVDKAREILVGL
jgi:hypothetical protein